METISKLYRQCFGAEPRSISPIEGAGSDRKYFRVAGVEDCIATVGQSVRENNAFIYLADYFAARCLPVPRVLAVSDDRLTYLQTDVGSTALYDLIERLGPDSPELMPMLEKAVRELARFSYCIDAEFDSSMCYPRPAMDAAAIMYDLNYFKYCFLKPCGVEFDEDALHADFERLASEAARNPESTLMLRDFQSRNIMVGADCCGADAPQLSVIDFQGARLGDGFYDLVSFAWQARAGFSNATRWHLADIYSKEVTQILGRQPENATTRIHTSILLRTLQVLGAYGFRGLIERKAKFVTTIPAALETLREILPSLNPELKELCRVANVIVDLPKFSREDYGAGLTVTVMSFSYKKGGIPDDLSGNGGGFVFDCRGMHNPGRYDQYKPLTGRDKEVIDFLEDQGEIQRFMDHCYGLVDPSVETYMRRGFSSLMVCFGCTGGRHRSVYGAEHMARHLSERFGVRVKLIHRERGITEIIPCR